jgi:1-acyl-sn-glycerol-3-phosphate acyltransferase
MTGARNIELVCIFPEGRLTADGEIGAFRPGLARILAANPVPVIPMAIVGLWGSMFSRQFGKLRQRLPRKLWHRVIVNVGSVVAPGAVAPGDTAPGAVAPDRLRASVCALYLEGSTA